MSHPLVLDLPKKSNAHWGKLYGCANALAIAEQVLSSTQLTLVVTPTSAEAFNLEDALRFFASDLTILSFPDWETLPYDLFSPHQDLSLIHI